MRNLAKMPFLVPLFSIGLLPSTAHLSSPKTLKKSCGSNSKMYRVVYHKMKVPDQYHS